MRALRLIILGVFALLLAVPAGAQDADRPQEDPAELEREAAAAREEAARLAAEAQQAEEDLARLQLTLVEAARARGDAEREALAVEARLSALSTEEAELLASAEADRRTLEDVFAALARMERARPPAALTSGGDALDAARAADLLADVAPMLDERAREALDRLASLQLVREQSAQERGALAATEATLALRREEIDALIAERAQRVAALRSDAEARAREAEALAARAQTLRELLAAIEARAEAFTPPPPPAARSGVAIPRLKPLPEDVGASPAPFVPPTGRFADARGRLSLPAAGSIVTRFGEAQAGVARDGMVVRTRQAAQVTSPFDARIEFAGEFPGYGSLLILGVGDGYHIVLAGLANIYGAIGQTVLAGEPIGEMPAAGAPLPDLYIEIRKGRQPIDPGPWWRSSL